MTEALKVRYLFCETCSAFKDREHIMVQHIGLCKLYDCQGYVNLCEVTIPPEALERPEPMHWHAPMV